MNQTARTTAACLIGTLLVTSAFAQRPSNPALLIPETAPELDYVFVPNAVVVPEGMTMGAPASVAFDANGHLFVLTRGDKTFFEFDRDGAFLRAFGDNLFVRSHGLYIDALGYLWATDVGGHVVVKLNRDGQTLLTLGTKGQAGKWDEASGSHKFDQPNDVVIAENGDIFVAQGHTPGPNGDARVLKFSKDGTFIKSWGGKGVGPGQFQVAHAIDIDRQGQVWVADRENQRIEVFQPDGTFVRELRYKGLPCDLAIGREQIYMVNGFAGQLLRLDLSGKVLAALGKPGLRPSEFGEAHSVAANEDAIYVGDSINGALLKFEKR